MKASVVARIDRLLRKVNALKEVTQSTDSCNDRYLDIFTEFDRERDTMAALVVELKDIEYSGAEDLVDLCAMVYGSNLGAEVHAQHVGPSNSRYCSGAKKPEPSKHLHWLRKLEKALRKARGSRPRIKRDEANVRARAALRNRPPRGKKRWTVRDLAKAIGCSGGLVPNLPAWEAYAEEHSLKRDKAHAAPKAVALTRKVLANEGCSDAQLERLIAEQAADFEGSPLVSKERKHLRRRAKV
jgi:hypothetical protein